MMATFSGTNPKKTTKQSVMQTSLSLIICTHNPRPEYFRRVLESLHAQTMPFEQWEFLVIDNASKELLRNTWDISWHPRGRHILEDEIGVTAARMRGIRESCGELLVFVDDDNVLAPDFLEQTLLVSRRHPFLGVFGAGRLEPEFEIQPPPELLSGLDLLALRCVPRAIWTNNPNELACIPYGAGLSVRRQIANHFVRVVQRLNITAIIGRRGQQLFSAEDDLFSLISAEAGQGFGLFPELKVTHLIRADRLNQRYFLRLIDGHAFSHAILRYLLAGIPQKRVRWIRYPRLFLHGIKNGQFSMRCGWAASRGEDRAARFISEHRLRSVEFRNLHFVNPVSE
jgi:glycosyltransferase involved in cell wall biosynthesis